MIKPPSLQHRYTLIFSGDPSLALPDEEDKRRETLRIARETGNWTPIIKVGEQPTLFQMRPLPGSTATWLHGEAQRRQLSEVEGFELALRCGLREIENFGAMKMKFEARDGETLVAREVIDALYGFDADANVGRMLVTELGAIVLIRTLEGISPK